MDEPTYEDVTGAMARLEGVVHKTPVLTSRQLNALAEAHVYLKCENFQRIGAFKFRGAYNAIACLPDLEKSPSIITVSSGNHAQGVALACQLHSLTAHIVMPKPINPIKREAALGYQAVVHEVKDRATADQKSQELAEALDGVLVHPFNQSPVIAGQGTLALEFLGQVPDLDIVLGPIGGGGLLSGVCLAAHGLNPDIEIYACEPAGALDAMYSVRENRVLPMENPQTLAEGLCTSLGTLTLPILREHLAGFFVVDEQEIVESMRWAFERLKIVIEPSSAVALAPLLRGEPGLRNKRVGVIISGGNVDLSHFFQKWQNVTRSGKA